MSSEAVAATGATSARDMGKVMGWLSPRTRGRADGRHVSELVAQRLAAADLAGHAHGAPGGVGRADDADAASRARRDLHASRPRAPPHRVRPPHPCADGHGRRRRRPVAASGSRSAAIAQDTIRAPRALTYESKILTDRARSDAADAVPFQYDYSPEKGGGDRHAAGSRVHAGGRGRRRGVQLDAQPGQPRRPAPEHPADADRRRPRDPASRSRRSAGRSCARKRSASSTTSSGPSSATPTSSTQRQFLGSRFQGDLSTDERDLADGADQSPGRGQLLLQRGVDRSRLATAAAAGVPPVTQTVQQGQVIVDAGHPITALDLETIDALGINESHLDAARLAGWFAAGGRCSSASCCAWVWRFRPELWHRNNVLLLVGIDARVRDPGAEADRRPIDPAVLPADGRGRDAARGPARRRCGDRGHARDRGPRRSRQRLLARTRRLRGAGWPRRDHRACGAAIACRCSSRRASRWRSSTSPWSRPSCSWANARST